MQWNVMEEEVEVESGKWISGSYWCFFPCEADEQPSTTIFLETDPTPGKFLSWSIRAPQSLYYPGTHSGTIEIEEGYPLTQPWLKISTPIFSPMVDDIGMISSAFDLGIWSPHYTIMDFLHSVAAMIVLDPFCRSSRYHLLPGIPLKHHIMVVRSTGDWSGKEDSFIRATNFFSRAYLQGDIRRASNPPITEHERNMSIIATQELLEHFTRFRSSILSNGSLKSNDPVTAFTGIQSTEEWIAEEKRWADAISLGCELGFI